MDEQNNNIVELEQDTEKLVEVRKDKLKELRANGRDPFEVTKFDRTHTSKDIKDNFDELNEKDVVIAGRIMGKRIKGKASFCHIQDIFFGICWQSNYYMSADFYIFIFGYINSMQKIF